jgi:SPP1 family predicted phage head-tail adaptor
MSFQNLLNKTCTIKARTVAQHATSGEQVETFAVKYSNVRCRLDEAAGGEYRGATRIVDKATHVLFINFNYNVIDTDAVVVGTETYNVLLVKDAGGHGHHKELMLEWVK